MSYRVVTSTDPLWKRAGVGSTEFYTVNLMDRCGESGFYTVSLESQSATMRFTAPASRLLRFHHLRPPFPLLDASFAARSASVAFDGQRWNSPNVRSSVSGRWQVVQTEPDRSIPNLGSLSHQ